MCIVRISLHRIHIYVMNIAPTHLRCAGDFFVVAWTALLWCGLPCCGRKRAIFVPTPSDFSLVIEESRSSGKSEAILGVRCVNYAATPTKTSEKPKFDPNNKE